MNNHTQKLSQSPQYIKGVGPRRIKALNKLGIQTIKDLLFHFPRRFEDRSHFTPINKVKLGEVETVRGKVLTLGLRRLRGRKTIFQIAIGDESGIIYGTWFNQPYLKKYFKVEDEVILHGKVDRYTVLQINSPEFEILRPDDDDTIHTGRVVPIYPATADAGTRYLRRVIKRCLDEDLEYIEDFLPKDILERNSLLPLKQAVQNYHFPESLETIAPAKRRLVFDEFFMLQLALAFRRSRIKTNRNGIAFKAEGRLKDKFKKLLPFELTASQKKVIEEIETDMGRKSPMNRLLQGDVGSGKTIVSIWAAVVCLQNGYQAALMAPTEILARQHYLTLCRFLGALGINIVLVSSSLKKKEKTAVLTAIKEHEAQVIVGTHALIQKEVKFKKLGLVIVDEQHKFGVMQRASLEKKGKAPDVLVMSATPIPRTLAITLYGDLDVSTIRELPPGRTPVKTYWISEKKRADLYKFLREKIAKKNQVYVVYPLVEESKLSDLKAATKMYEHFKKDIFPDLRVGLLHGRMKDAEKREVMSDFKSGALDILVATTVIEVGVDVPNASVMLIEHSERFGLSQLHQLRGRVGRGQKQAYCILLSTAESEEARKRLSAMIKTTDGFKIAEVDLLIRGPGEFFGTRQHGMPELKIADLVADRDLLVLARKEAFGFFEEHQAEISDKENDLNQELRQRCLLDEKEGLVR